MDKVFIEGSQHVGYVNDRTRALVSANNCETQRLSICVSDVFKRSITIFVIVSLPSFIGEAREFQRQQNCTDRT